MNRRSFLRSTGAACAGFALANSARVFPDTHSPNAWRTFEVSTKVEVLKPSGVTRIWLPAALIRNTPFQRTLANRYKCEAGTVKFIKDERNALGIVLASYAPHHNPVLTLDSRVMVKDYDLDPSVPESTPKVSQAELRYFLEPTRYVPTNGLVRETALKAIAGRSTEVEKARAIYDWIVENTFRDPNVKGCGRGDVGAMLESGNLRGKCADLNALFVAMARSVGLPARDVYGVRIAKSEFGYKSLGLSTDNATKAQHCRAEVYLSGHGWVPVDPADVRKVVLEEPPGNRPLSDEAVARVRRRLFGSWEMNWMAYNYGHEVELPGSSRTPMPYFMYPQAETAEGPVDPLDPDNFKYEITAKEIG